MGRPLEAPRAMPRFRVADHWAGTRRATAASISACPSPTAASRTTGRALRTALRTIFAPFGAADPAVAAGHADRRPAIDDRERVDGILKEHGVALPMDVTPVARWAMACPALPSCGLALNEAERIRVPLIDEIEQALTRHGLRHERISRAHHRLPERLRPALCRRYRPGRPHPRPATRSISAAISRARGSTASSSSASSSTTSRRRWSRSSPSSPPRRRGESFGDFARRLGQERLLALAEAPAAA